MTDKIAVEEIAKLLEEYHDGELSDDPTTVMECIFLILLRYGWIKLDKNKNAYQRRMQKNPKQIRI